MELIAGFAPGLPWCTAASAYHLPAEMQFGCLPHVNQSLCCCEGDELLNLQEHTQQVLRYRRQALSNSADNMDAMVGEAAKDGMCEPAQQALAHLHEAFVEARVLAIGGLEVLRMGVQDISCQVCWASDPARSAQVLRVLRRDVDGIFRRLQALRSTLPAWRPCLPTYWRRLSATVFPPDVAAAPSGRGLVTLQRWLESIAVELTAAAGEFNSLAFSLRMDTLPLGHPSGGDGDVALGAEASLSEVPVPNRLAERRAAVLIEGCADLAYPKIDFVTAGKEECAQIWRKFPYADPSTAVTLPDAAVRLVARPGLSAASAAPSLERVRRAVEGPPGELPELGEGLELAPVAPAFEPRSLDAARPQSGKALVFVCKHTSLCGGHGDRLFGLLSAYLAALLSGREFFVDMMAPVPLATVLQPRRPWPAVTHGCATYRWTSAEDLANVGDDVERLMHDEQQVICVASNVRLFQVLLRQDRSRKYARAGLLSGLFRDLFRLAVGPTALLSGFIESLQGRPLLGIHFRAGNECTWTDPARHGLPDLETALSCAAAVEEILGLPRTTAWLLAADTDRARTQPAVEQLSRAGKVVFLESQPTHIDRSQPDTLGIEESWAVWWALAFRTEALVLSHSNFGWSAAEIGQRRAFHFPTCRPADVTSP